MRRFALLIAGVLALSGLAWYLDEEPKPPVVIQRPSPQPTMPPRNPLRDAVRDAVTNAPPQIIERETVRERASDDDDDGDQPDVRVVVPRSTQRPTPAAPAPSRTTPPPRLPIEIPALPAPPEVKVPNPGLPLLP
jgi:hypothetical protein